MQLNSLIPNALDAHLLYAKREFCNESKLYKIIKQSCLRFLKPLNVVCHIQRMYSTFNFKCFLVCKLTDLDISQEWVQNSSTFFKIASKFGILSYLPLAHQILAQNTLSVSTIDFGTNIQQQIYGELKASLQWLLHTHVSGIMHTHLRLCHFPIYRSIY
jgi:hypothetical protein